jgi:peptide subunit release factor 1 (eRF1)
VIAAVAKRREDELFDSLAQRLGTGERAARGLQDVLAAVTEQRLETLLVDDGLAAPGRRCTNCGLLALPEVGRCPADDADMTDVADVVEVAVERAIGQSAAVHILRDRPELEDYGGIAALLRF